MTESNKMEQIKQLFDQFVRPVTEADGGEITIVSLEENVLYVEMHGSCDGCPSSMITLKDNIENMLQHVLQEHIIVEAINMPQMPPMSIYDMADPFGEFDMVEDVEFDQNENT